jgi:hypothetical protein
MDRRLHDLLRSYESAKRVNAGVSVQWTSRFSTYVSYDGQLGRDRYDSNGVSGGFRIHFLPTGDEWLSVRRTAPNPIFRTLQQRAFVKAS